MGRTLDRLARFSEALDAFRQAASLVQSDRSDPGRVGLAMCLHVIGNLLEDLGQLEESAASFRRALVIREALAAKDRDNTRWQGEAAGTRHRLTEILAQLSPRIDQDSPTLAGH